MGPPSPPARRPLPGSAVHSRRPCSGFRGANANTTHLPAPRPAIGRCPAAIRPRSFRGTDPRAGFAAGRRRRSRRPSHGSPRSGGRMLPPGAAGSPRPSRIPYARAPRLSSSLGPGLSESRNEYTPLAGPSRRGSHGRAANRAAPVRGGGPFLPPQARRSRARRYRGRERRRGGVGRRPVGVVALVGVGRDGSDKIPLFAGRSISAPGRI